MTKSKHVSLETRARERGLKIIEAKKPLILSVNAKDIKLATIKEADECAFARCCKRTHPEVEAAYFFKSIAYLQTKDTLTRYKLPASVQKEIVAFDRGGSFEPGNYSLKPITPANTLKALRARKVNRGRGAGARANTGRGTTAVRHVTTDVRPTFNVLS